MSSRGKRKKATKSKPLEKKAEPVSHRLHAVRERMWGAAAVASCVEYAASASLPPSRGKPDIEGAMCLLDNYINQIAGDMEEIVEELGGPPDEQE